VPYDIPTMKEKLFIWLSLTVDHLNQDWSGVEHCWKETDLLRAWYAYILVTYSVDAMRQG
jgi:hypothetical protein